MFVTWLADAASGHGGMRALEGVLMHHTAGAGTGDMIAAGLCYEFLGIEAESAGVRDDWTAEQRDCYPRLCAAVLRRMGRGADRYAGHKEVGLAGDEDEMAGTQTVLGAPGANQWLVIPIGRVGGSALIPKGGKAWAHLATPDRDATIELWALADRGPDEYPLHHGPFPLPRDDRPSWELSAVTTSVSVRYTAQRPVGLSVEWTRNA